MEGEKRLEQCKKCIEQKMDMQQGLICNLTGCKADFTGQCSNFKIDPKVEAKEQERLKLIRPNKRRAEIAQLLVWAVMIVNIIDIYASYLQYNLLISIQNNEAISEQTINYNDQIGSIIDIISFILHISSGVIFIRWFRRAYYNLNLRVKCKHSEGWAAGSWFTPIVCIYRPYKIMKEMWVKTTKIINSKSDNHIEVPSTTIGIWWTLWIISGYIGNFSLRSELNAETIEDFFNSTTADIITSIIGIPLAIITVMIIKSYSLREEELNKISL